MKKIILTFLMKKSGKQLSLPVYADNENDAKLFGSAIERACENFAGERAFKLESAKEVSAES